MKNSILFPLATPPVTYNLEKIRLIELQAEPEELTQSESTGMNIVNELILLSNLLQTPLGHKWQSHKQSQNKTDTSCSSDFDSRVHITTPVFDFHEIINALTTTVEPPVSNQPKCRDWVVVVYKNRTTGSPFQEEAQAHQLDGR